MWNELENTYNLQGVTELENEIKAKKKELLSVHEETKAQVQVMRAQNKLLGEQEAYTEKRKDQASSLDQTFRAAKKEFKAKKEEQRQLVTEVKSKHE